MAKQSIAKQERKIVGTFWSYFRPGSKGSRVFESPSVGPDGTALPSKSFGPHTFFNPNEKKRREIVEPSEKGGYNN